MKKEIAEAKLKVLEEQIQYLKQFVPQPFDTIKISTECNCIYDAITLNSLGFRDTRPESLYNKKNKLLCDCEEDDCIIPKKIFIKKKKMLPELLTEKQKLKAVIVCQECLSPFNWNEQNKVFAALDLNSQLQYEFKEVENNKGYYKYKCECKSEKFWCYNG